MNGFNLRAAYIGRRSRSRGTVAIGLINPIYNLARYEPRHRMSGLPAA